MPIARRHRLGDLFTRVLAKCVGDLVAHHDGDLGVGQLQLVDQPGVEHDFAAGHHERVHLVAGDEVDFPVPTLGVGTEYRALRYDPPGDRTHTLQHRRLRVERALFRGIRFQGRIGFRAHLGELFRRHQQQLRTVRADGAGAGGAGRTTDEWTQGECRREGYLGNWYVHAFTFESNLRETAFQSTTAHHALRYSARRFPCFR